MASCRFLGIVFCCLLASTSTLYSQTKTYEVDGQRIRLEVDPNWILLRVKKGVKPTAAVEAGVRAQAQLLDTDPIPYLARVTEETAEMIPRIGGVLVPRLKGLQANQIQTLAERLDEVESAEIVFRYFGMRSAEPAERDAGRVVLLEGPITVRFREAPAPQVAEVIRELGYVEFERPEYVSHVVRYKPTRPATDPFFVSEKIQGMREIMWAEPDLIYDARLGEPAKSPNDVHFKKQWYLQSGVAGINAPEAWLVATGSDSVTVAVIDDGVDLKHPDLKGKLVAGYDFLENDNDPQPNPKDSHGTACAGIIGSVTNNDLGTAGIAWGCRIMPLRIGFGRLFSDDAAAKSFRFAHTNKAQVISCSWGGGPPSRKIKDAIKEVSEGDAACLVVAAAGNSRPALDVFFPANYQPCIAIGAVHPDNTRWDYSCYGPDNEVDLVAPSGDLSLRGDIWTADHSGANGYSKGGADAEEPSGDYTGRFGGTSAAAPIASGVAALIWSTCPKKLTAPQVRDILEKTANQVDQAQGAWTNGRSKFYGLGKVDALKAIHMAKQMCGGADGNFEGTAALIRLLRTLEPSAESYDVDNERVNLHPNLEWIAVYADARPASQDWRKALIRPEVQNRVLDEPIPAQGTSRKIFLVPRSVLRDLEELKAAAMSGALPEIGPVYSSRGSFLIPFGTFTARLKGAATRQSAMDFAAKHGLRAVEDEGETLKFAPDRKSKFGNIFEAMRAFEKTGTSAWVEPDFARSVEQFHGQTDVRPRP